MDKNQIRGIRRQTSEQMIAKSISIKVAGCKSGGCVLKAVSLTTGGLLHVLKSELREERSSLTVRQKSAAGVVGHAVGAASEALQGRKAEQWLGQPGTMATKAQTIGSGK